MITTETSTHIKNSSDLVDEISSIILNEEGHDWKDVGALIHEAAEKMREAAALINARIRSYELVVMKDV
jgi:hypothetical protein